MPGYNSSCKPGDPSCDKFTNLSSIMNNSNKLNVIILLLILLIIMNLYCCMK